MGGWFHKGNALLPERTNALNLEREDAEPPKTGGCRVPKDAEHSEKGDVDPLEKEDFCSQGWGCRALAESRAAVPSARSLRQEGAVQRCLTQGWMCPSPAAWRMPVGFPAAAEDQACFIKLLRFWGEN